MEKKVSLLRAASTVLAVALLAPAAAAAPIARPDPAERVLNWLHDGRFGEAEAAARDAVRSRPHDPEAVFLHAFVLYWRLLYDPEDESVAVEFERRLDRAVEVAGRAIDEKEGDQGSHALWKGSAHLLLAQLRASQRKPFGAAFEAKKAKRLLERAVADDSPPAEADFGIGAYQYYADQVPSLVKGIRTLLFIPGGDREEGLARLERAARKSRYFGLEARILLASIYADRREQLFDVALAHARTALEEHPDSIAVLHGVAHLELSLHRPESAIVHLERALARARSGPPVDEDVVATLRYYAGRAELDSFRPDLALEHLRPLIEEPGDAPTELVERARRLVGSAAALLGDDAPPWVARARPADAGGDPDDLARARRAAPGLTAGRAALRLERRAGYGSAADELDRLARERDTDSTLALLAGRAALFDRRPDPAAAWLRRAEVDRRLPERFLGTARLLLGMASDLRGDRGAALAWYERAEETAGFRADDAVRLYRSRPCGFGDLPVSAGGGDPRAGR